MAKNVVTFSRSYLPGAGKDQNGQDVQRKQRVVGEVNVTSYSRGGESLTPADLGLTRVDHIDLRVVNPVKSQDPTQGLRTAHWSDDAQEFYVIRELLGGTAVELADTTAVKIRFTADGDSADGNELL